MAYTESYGGRYAMDPVTGQTYRRRAQYQGGGIGRGRFDLTGDYIKPNASDPNAQTMSNEYKFDKDVARYDAEAQKYRDQVLAYFGQAADYNAATQQRGIQANLNQFLAQRGISGRSGLAASLAANTQGKLGQQVQGAKLDFNARVMEAMRQERDAFVKGEFDFIQRMQIMAYQTELEKELMNFRNDLMKDQNRWNAFMSVAGKIGAVAAGFFLGGPVGAGVAAGLTTQSDEYGMA